MKSQETPPLIVVLIMRASIALHNILEHPWHPLKVVVMFGCKKSQSVTDDDFQNSHATSTTLVVQADHASHCFW